MEDAYDWLTDIGLNSAEVFSAAVELCAFVRVLRPGRCCVQPTLGTNERCEELAVVQSSRSRCPVTEPLRGSFVVSCDRTAFTYAESGWRAGTRDGGTGGAGADPVRGQHVVGEGGLLLGRGWRFLVARGAGERRR